MIRNLNPSSKKFQTVQLPAGTQDLAGLIMFLSDKKAVVEHFDKLTRLTKEVNAAIEATGKVDEITRLLDDAKIKNDLAKESLESQTTKVSKVFHDAQEQASKTLVAAKSEATRLIDKATKEADKLTSEATEREEATKTAFASATAREAAALDKELAISVLEKSAQAREQSLIKKEAEIARKMKILGQL